MRGPNPVYFGPHFTTCLTTIDRAKTEQERKQNNDRVQQCISKEAMPKNGHWIRLQSHGSHDLYVKKTEVVLRATQVIFHAINI